MKEEKIRQEVSTPEYLLRAGCWFSVLVTAGIWVVYFTAWMEIWNWRIEAVGVLVYGFLGQLVVFGLVLLGMLGGAILRTWTGMANQSWILLMLAAGAFFCELPCLRELVMGAFG